MMGVAAVFQPASCECTLQHLSLSCPTSSESCVRDASGSVNGRAVKRSEMRCRRDE